MKPHAPGSIVRVRRGPYEGMSGIVQYRHVNGCYGVAMTCRAEVMMFQANQIRVEAMTPAQTAEECREDRIARSDAGI